MTTRGFEWRLRKKAGTPPVQWAERLGVPPKILEVLSRRGLTRLEDMDEFLSPLVAYLQAPEKWPGMKEAAEVLVDAILAPTAQPPHRPGLVLVWGDYDVDGITGATLCTQVLQAHGVPVVTHLPERNEGYGLNIHTLERLCGEHSPVALLTVDCGISDNAAVARARELGLTVVISDHHLPPELLPDAHALCNPRLAEASPCAHLAGVGVAFFLLALVNRKLAERLGTSPVDLRSTLDLVALGTLADMVSLTGQNRILAKNGLLKIAEALRPGLAELKEASGFTRKAALSAGQVGFQLAPRINAAGRVGSAMEALRLLMADETTPTLKLAERLNTLNQNRRAEEERICQEAMAQAESLITARPDLAALVVYGADWHQGVIGIVASRLVEQWYRPVLVLCDNAGQSDPDGPPQLKGSGRSIREFDLHAGLASCADILESFGGHKQAAGLRLRLDNLENLRRRFHEVALAAVGSHSLRPTLHVDGELGFPLASDFTFLKALDLLQPFGIGNPEPVFVSPLVRVQRARTFGHKKEHLALHVQEPESGITLQAKAWRRADAIRDLQPGASVRLAFTPGINTYNGVASVELVVRDWTTKVDIAACLEDNIAAAESDDDS